MDIARSLEVAASNLQNLKSTIKTPGNCVSKHDINKVHARNILKKRALVKAVHEVSVTSMENLGIQPQLVDSRTLNVTNVGKWDT